MLLTNSLGETDLTWEWGNQDSRAISSILNLAGLSIPLPRSTETIKLVGVSSQPMTASKSLLISFQLGSVQGTHQFLLVSSAAVHLLRWDFYFETHKAHIFSPQKGEIFLQLELLTNNTQKYSAMDLFIATSVFLVTLTEPNPFWDSITK